MIRQSNVSNSFTRVGLGFKSSDAEYLPSEESPAKKSNKKPNNHNDTIEYDDEILKTEDDDSPI